MNKFTFTMDDVCNLADRGEISDSLYACLLIADRQWELSHAA